MQQTAGRGYILGGYLGTVFCHAPAPGGPPSDQSGPNRGDDDYWVIKLDAQDHKQWDRTLGGAASDRLYCVRQTTDGGYLRGGTSQSAASGDKSARSLSSDYWAVKLNAQGVKQWGKVYGGSDTEDLRDLCLTSDGGYLLGGFTKSPVSCDRTEPLRGGDDYWVIRLYPEGAVSQPTTRIAGDTLLHPVRGRIGATAGARQCRGPYFLAG